MLPRFPVTLGTGGTPVGGGGGSLPSGGWSIPYPTAEYGALIRPLWVFGQERWVQSGMTSEEWFA